MRLNKYIASQGIASRRGADKLIEEGAVSVNGKPAQMGMQIEEGIDVVEVDKKTLDKKQEDLKYFALYKPRGYVTSTKKTAMEDKNFLDCFPSHVTQKTRLFPIGRLDKDSEGLLLVTNDGDITFKLTHPSFEHEKEYEVEIFNDLTDETMQLLRRPFYMLGQKTLPAEVEKLGPKKFSIILREGKNRQIRRMVRSIGSGVRTLRRIRVGKFLLPPDVQAGDWTEITKEEIL